MGAERNNDAEFPDPAMQWARERAAAREEMKTLRERIRVKLCELPDNEQLPWKKQLRELQRARKEAHQEVDKAFRENTLDVRMLSPAIREIEAQVREALSEIERGISQVISRRQFS